jgi:hypothetical protein
MWLKSQSPIQSPAKYEVCSVIPFFNTKCERPAKIHNQIVTVYGDVMTLLSVMKWCCEFSEGRTDVHNEQRSGRPSLISDELLQKTEGEFHANQRGVIRGLHHIIPEVSKTTIHEAVTKIGIQKIVRTLGA